MGARVLAQEEHPITAETKLVVSHGTWRKHDYVDVRVHWQSPDGAWFPTKKGVRLEPDLARQLTDNIREMLGVTEIPENGNGNHNTAPDLSVLAFLGTVAEHIKVGEVLEGPSWGRAVRDFSLRMASLFRNPTTGTLRFQRPDAPYTAIFSPLMRDRIEAEIARIRNTKKPRRASQRPQDGVVCWDVCSTAKKQHPDHPMGQGASYCEKCHPHTLGRACVIPARAQRCIDSGISHDPLPEGVFAWRRDLDARSAKQAQQWRDRFAA